MRAKAWPTEGLKITEKIIDGIPIKVHADRPRSLREILGKAVGTSPEKIALIYQAQIHQSRPTDRIHPFYFRPASQGRAEEVGFHRLGHSLQ